MGLWAVSLMIRFHDCRHTAATIMLSHGIPPVIMAGMLGHSISILLTTYAHFIPTMQDQAAMLVDDILMPTLLSGK
jgi:integrase